MIFPAHGLCLWTLLQVAHRRNKRRKVMLNELATLLIGSGAAGLLAQEIIVYKDLNKAQISMSAFDGDETREHHHGITFKPPWWRLQGSEIDMRTSVILTSGGIHIMSWEEFLENKISEIKPRPYETSDGVLFGTWATAVMPLRDYLKNMLRRTPGAGALMTLAKIELEMSKAVHDLTTDQALAQKAAIGEKVAAVFGGENIISPHEKSYGLNVLDPELFDLNYGKISEDAAQKRIVAREFRKSVEDMLSAVGNDPDKALSAVEVATGVAKRNIFQLEGLPAIVKSITEAFTGGGKK